MSKTHALYIAVFEHKGAVLQGLTREFMRHTGIWEKVDDEDENTFNIYHVQGTPGIGLQYRPVRRWKDSRNETAQLLLLGHLSDIPADRCSVIDNIARSIPVVASRTWNCQNWVEELLDALAAKDIISHTDKNDGIRMMRDAVQLPFTSKTPRCENP